MIRVPRRSLLMLPALILPTLFSGCLESSAPPADLILNNGIVHALDESESTVSAIAIRLGRIQSLGDDEEVLKFRGDDTRVIDLKGATVIPGLIDAHTHLLNLGEAILNQATGEGLYLDLSNTESQEDAVQRVRARARALSAGQWILGKGWNEERWITQELPNKRLLSEIVRYNPVFLVRSDGETVWVNQKALDAARIDKGTPDPPGGRILRKPRSHEPNGILIGRAWQPVLRRVPALSSEDRTQAVLGALERLAGMGYTMVHTTGSAGRLGLDDLGAPEDDTADLFRMLATSGRLPIRVGLIIPGPSNAADDLLQRGPEIGIGDGMLDIRCVKLIADGVLGNRTAALLQPYDDDPTTSGMPALTDEEIAAWGRRGLESGVQIAVHAVGDAAVRAAAAGFGRALAGRPEADARFRIEHLTLFTPPDLSRLGRAGAVATVQPASLRFLMDGRVDETRVGLARAARMYAFHSMLKAGVRLAGSSDAKDRVDHPLFGFYAAVTRQTPAGIPEGGWNPQQRLGRLEALRLFTIGAAYAGFREKEAGSIEAGKWADLTLLSRDIMTIPVGEILRTEVLATYVAGREVYMRESAPSP